MGDSDSQRILGAHERRPRYGAGGDYLMKVWIQSFAK